MKLSPFDLCTFDANSNCKECKANGKLDCKLDIKQQKKSMKAIFSFVIIAVFGLVITALISGNWLILATYLIFVFLFFFVIQVKITCTHCPYYTEDKKLLNCPGNNIFPKIWKFNPKPISRIEQTGTIIGFGLLGIIPIFSEIYVIWLVYLKSQNLYLFVFFGPVILLIVTIVSYMFFILLFLLNYCPKCLNFSCRFNKVPEDIRDEYLNKNPIIREAWDKNSISKGK